MYRRLVRVLVGFALAALVVGTFLWAVGFQTVAESLAGADLLVFAFGFLGVLGALLCWSEAFRLLLAGLGESVSGLRFRTAYVSSEFPKQVIPMGQAVAPVFVSYAVSSRTDASADGTLAAATVVAFVNITASMVVASGGLAYLVVTKRGPTGPLLGTTLAALVTGVVLLLVSTMLLHYRRPLVENAVVRLARAIRASVGRVSARIRVATDPDAVRGRFASYYEGIDGVLASPRSVGGAGLFCVAGWLLFLVPMYTSFRALGAPIPYALALFAVPVVTLLNVVPLPGGLGGFEVAAAALVSVIGAVTLPTAAAGVFLFRLTNYWFIVLVSGLASATLSMRLSDPPAVLPEEGADPDR